MKFPRLRKLLPDWKNAALAFLSAVLLVLAFPDFEFSFLAWFGLVPLLCAIDREMQSGLRSFFLGWFWGVTFFTGTCWWLTFAPITYAGFPWPVAYLLLFVVTGIVAIFPGMFAAILSLVIRRFGTVGLLAAPFIWVFSEFVRYWVTGNNWNALGYVMAFQGGPRLLLASYGGVYILTSYVWFWNTYIGYIILLRGKVTHLAAFIAYIVVAQVIFFGLSPNSEVRSNASAPTSNVVAIQPNVPMSDLTPQKWEALRTKHVELSESVLATVNHEGTTNTTVVFPESPMNFMWNDDLEFQKFIRTFANRNNVNVLFNSAEPDGPNNKYFNSAVLVGPDGKEIAQYDKIYLLPFGESVPAPLQAIVPAFVGSFSYGKEYDLLPLGEARAGVMICFESHFGELSRHYVRDGADVLIEMTNDGYLGPTPVLRQHLANAVFRAVETNRPVLRVTNVGITAYINERGEVLDPAESYSEATRVWPVGKSDGSQTYYVKYGDWFAWLCSIVTIGMLGWALMRPKGASE